MGTEKKDLSYYTLRLQELLNASFPELSDDIIFIKRRSRLASLAYEGAFIGGNEQEECNRIAEYILFEGLYFSRFDAVFKVVCNEFDTAMADGDLRPFAIKMLRECEFVFKKYQLAEDFADSGDYDHLYTELTGAIGIWIDENGL